jgi:hypothetical protein
MVIRVIHGLESIMVIHGQSGIHVFQPFGDSFASLPLISSHAVCVSLQGSIYAMFK